MRKVKYYVGHHLKTDKFHKKQYGPVDTIEEATLFDAIGKLKNSIRQTYPSYGYDWSASPENGEFEILTFEINLDGPLARAFWPESK